MSPAASRSRSTTARSVIECSFDAPERQSLEIVGTEAAVLVDRAHTPGPEDVQFALRKGDGSVESGHAAAEEFLLRAGVHPEHWSLQDGSGLSRSDILSPHEMVSLLAAMDRHRYADAFRASLPVAGVDGTLKNRMKGTPAEGRVVAKTGTLRHVNALAGYLTTRSGERLVFYLASNHNTVPGAEVTGAFDDVCNLLVGR